MVKSMISKLQRSIDLRGRNISFDRLYTSIPLCKWLLEHGITTIGTLKSNRRGIPEEFKKVEGREELSYQVLWEESEKKIVLHSYVVKNKTTGLRNVLMLSTVQPLLGVTKDDKKSKPAIYKLYDFTKGGTDIVDQRVGFYTCKTKSPRWTMVAFFYLLDTCRVNSSTVYCMNQKTDPRKQNSFEYGWKLSMELVLPHIGARPINGLTSVVRQKISFILGPPEPEKESSKEQNLEPATLLDKSEIRRRCAECMDVIKGDGQKKKKDALGRTRMQCQRCGKAVCRKHTVMCCRECLNEKP